MTLIVQELWPFELTLVSMGEKHAGSENPFFASRNTGGKHSPKRLCTCEVIGFSATLLYFHLGKYICLDVNYVNTTRLVVECNIPLKR